VDENYIQTVQIITSIVLFQFFFFFVKFYLIFFFFSFVFCWIKF